MAQKKMRQGSTAEDLEQVASVISFLVHLDQRGQEQIHEAEQHASMILDSVGTEIAILEQEAQEHMEMRLSAYANDLEKNSARTIAEAEQRYDKTRQTLIDQAQRYRKTWVEELLRRALQTEHGKS